MHGLTKECEYNGQSADTVTQPYKKANCVEAIASDVSPSNYCHQDALEVMRLRIVQSFMVFLYLDVKHSGITLQDICPEDNRTSTSFQEMNWDPKDPP